MFLLWWEKNVVNSGNYVLPAICLHFTSNIFIIYKILIIGLNISASSNNFLEHCSHFPCLHIWSGDPNFFWIHFFYRVKIRLHDKNQLPRLTENSLKVCMGGVGSHQLLCHSKLYFQLRCQLHITVSTIFLTNQTNFHVSYTACILLGKLIDKGHGLKYFINSINFIIW